MEAVEAPESHHRDLILCEPDPGSTFAYQEGQLGVVVHGEDYDSIFKQVFSEGDSLRLVLIKEGEFPDIHVPKEEVATIHLFVGFVGMQREAKLLPNG